jgi:hypothetical protein
VAAGGEAADSVAVVEASADSAVEADSVAVVVGRAGK